MTTRLLEGRTALITGGGSGIGLGCARRLLENGARVTIVGRTITKLENAAEQLRKEISGAHIDFKQCDVTVEADIEAAVAASTNEKGHLDIAVANVGTATPGPILHVTADGWKWACEHNIMGTALTIKHAAIAMKECGGSIVTISSVASNRVGKWLSTYSTTKAGVDMLTRCAAVELGPFKIRVNCIQPGYVPTYPVTDAFEKQVMSHTALGRPGMAEEIGDAVVFLTSDKSAWVSGQVFGVCGGLGIPVGEDFEYQARSFCGDEVMDKCMTNPAKPETKI